MSMDGTTSTSTVEARLQALESKLGTTPEDNSSVSSRLDAISAAFKSVAAPVSNNKDIQSINSIDIHTLSYVKAPKSTPFVLRLQQLLACYETMRADMEQLSTLCGLLNINNTNNDNNCREDQVTQADVLVFPNVSLDDQRRLDALSVQLQNIKTRTNQVAARIDSLVDRHYTMLSVISKKTVLADEFVSGKEK